MNKAILLTFSFNLQLWRVENEVEALKKGMSASSDNSKGDNMQESKQVEDDSNKNGENNDGEGNTEGQETVDGSSGDGGAVTRGNDEWTMDVEGEPDDLEYPPGEEIQQGSEPLEAEVSSDDEDDDETIRATRRGRVTRSAKTSPKGAKKRVKKL